MTLCGLVQTTLWGRRGWALWAPRVHLRLQPRGISALPVAHPIEAPVLQLSVTLPDGLLWTCGLSQEFWVLSGPPDCCPWLYKVWPQFDESCGPLPPPAAPTHSRTAASRHLSTGQARRHPSAGVMEPRGHGPYGYGLSHLQVSSEVSQRGPVGHSLGTESAHFHSHLALEPFFPDLR